MPFTGTAVVKQVSDRLVRVTGLAVPAGSAGAFALWGSVPEPLVGPDLGAAERFGVLAPIYVNTDATAGSLIVGNLGYVTPPLEFPSVTGATHVDDDVYDQALLDMATARTALQALTATFTFTPGNINLGTDTTHGTAATYTPGVYVITGNASTSASATISLDGPGLYVFRISGTLITGAGTVIQCTNGAEEANVFWVVGGNVAIGSNNDAVGTFMPTAASTMSIIAVDDANVSTLIGRMLGFSTTTTTLVSRITVPFSVGTALVLPRPFRPRTFAYLGAAVALQDSVQVTYRDVASSNSVAPAIAVVKTGTTVANFLATITNTDEEIDSPVQEFYIRFHE